MCGGTRRGKAAYPSLAGLSPRVRGNHDNWAMDLEIQGSIPACAGEPRAPALVAPAHWVYPRVCGGTAAGGAPTGATRGLSPRVRGNPARRL